MFEDPLTLFFGIITIISMIMAIIFFIKSQRFKQLTCVYRNDVLHTQSHPSVRILFNDEEIDNLTRAKIVIFNSGSDAIRREDLPVVQWPTLCFRPDDRILSHVIESTSSDGNQFFIQSIQKHKLDFKFDYLNSLEGATIECLYQSGQSQDGPAITIIAPIINGRSAKILKFSAPPTILLFIVFEMFLAFFLVLSVIGTYQTIINILLEYEHTLLFGLTLLICACGIVILGMVSMARVYSHKLPQFARDYFT